MNVLKRVQNEGETELEWETMARKKRRRASELNSFSRPNWCHPPLRAITERENNKPELEPHSRYQTASLFVALSPSFYVILLQLFSIRLARSFLLLR